jgi:hypothetical protein
MKRCREAFEEQLLEKVRKQATRTKKSRLAGDPRLTVRRDPTRWDEAMHMGMVLQGTAPGVQEGGDADLGTEVLGISGNTGQRFGGNL